MDKPLEGLSGSRTRRYVFGPGIDEPLTAYLVQTSGTTRTWYYADERGSIIGQTDDSGTPLGAGGAAFDEYGVGLGSSRFHYTGQYWLGEQLHYYRARIYDPTLGRFLQTDPIGYGAGMNMYAYVGGDPVNFTDPLGLDPNTGGDIIVTAIRCNLLCRIGRAISHNIGGGSSSGSTGGTYDLPPPQYERSAFQRTARRQPSEKAHSKAKCRRWKPMQPGRIGRRSCSTGFCRFTERPLE